MEYDRLAKLMARIETGAASDAELNELEDLLASDHAQIEGLLYGIGRSADESKVVNLPASGEEVAATAAKRWWLSGVAAALVVGAVAFSNWLPQGKQEGVELADVSKPTKRVEKPPKLKMFEKERYDRTGMNTLGGASNVHPETGSNGELVVGGKIEFNRDIRPILSDKCFACHGPDEAERAADLRLDTEEGATADLGGYAAIVKGNAKDSELFFRIHDDDPNYIMPPPESHRQLTPKEKKILERWIDQGAEWQKH